MSTFDELNSGQGEHSLTYKELEAQVEALNSPVLKSEWQEQLDRIAELESQLPESMQDCIIIFKECEVGHGWLTAKNWKQFDCPTCRIAELEAQLAETQKELLRENDLFLAMRERATKSKQHI